MNTYLIVSETIYKREEKIKELTEGIPNIVKFNLDENTVEEVLQEASYFSMFDDKKCVIVSHAKFFGSSKISDSTKSKEDAEKLLKYLDNENSNTRLIFTYEGKCDSKKKIYNLIKNAGNLFLYEPMTRTDMKNELYKIVLNNKYRVEDKTLWYIVNNTLGNFDLCVNELNKIMLFYSKPCDIKYEDATYLVSKSIEDNNFKLVDSIIARDLESSLKILEDFKILKVEPNIIISLLYREYKLMLSIILYEDAHYNHYDILKELKLTEWQYNKTKEHARRYNLRELKEEIVKIGHIDYQFKSGLINKDTMLISYIIDVCC